MMRIVAEVLMVLGAIIAVLAAIGALRFNSSYARLHAAGKASPIAFLVTGLGASLVVGGQGAAYIAIAALAMTLTLPLGVHLLFRALYRTSQNDQLVVDELANDEHTGHVSSPPR